MNQRGMKFAAFALTGVILTAGTNLATSATGIAAVLPVAGLALTLGEGTSVNVIKKEVEEQKAEPTANSTTEIDKKERISLATILPSSVKDAPTVSGNVTDTVIPEVGSTEEPVVPDAIIPEDGIETTISGNEVEEVTEIVEEPVEDKEEKYFSTLVIARVNDYVNVRSTPSEEGEILGKLYDKSVGEFVSEKDGWYEITSGNVTGFVKAEYVVTGEEAIALAKEVGHRLASVTTTTLFVREQASTDAAVLGMVPIEDELSVLEELDGWVKVSIEEGEGFVSSEYVTLHTEFVKAESKAEEEARKQKEEQERQAARAAAEKVTKTNSGSSKNTQQVAAPATGGSANGNAVANFATQFVGNPYVYGGTSLTNGADCSGFVMSVYDSFGVGLPHSSGAQRSKGYDVGGLANAQPGDIVCYSGHVGIYIGGGNIVHASTAKTGIKVSNASYRQVLSVRRIF